MNKKLVTDSIAATVRDVREYVKFQKEMWSLVPALALENDGRSGFNEAYACAYQSRLWPIDDPIHHRIAFIDLRSGEIVENDGSKSPASDRVILLLAGHLDDLDARALVKALRKGTERPCESYVLDRIKHEKHARRIDRWRAQMRKDYNVPKAASSLKRAA